MYEGRIPQGWISCFPGASFLPSLPFFSTTGREQPCPIRNRRCRGYHWASCQIPQGDFIAVVEMPLQTSILLMRSAKTRHGFPLWRLPSITLKTAIYCKKNDFFCAEEGIIALTTFRREAPLSLPQNPRNLQKEKDSTHAQIACKVTNIFRKTGQQEQQ